MRERDYFDYVNDILESIEDAEEFTAGMTFDQFTKDKKTKNAVIRSLEVLGEAAKQLPKNIKVKQPDIPWKRMMGMRNRLVHEYFGVDLKIVWTVVHEELPPLKPALKKLLSEIEK